MNVLRIYDPAECDEQGVPLDWDRCRACDGTGERPGGPVDHPVPPGGIVRSMTLCYCEACDGHGSLRAVALKALYGQQPGTLHGEPPVRCRGCGHPMSDGTWGDVAPSLRVLPGARLPGGRGYLSPGLREEGPFSAEQWQCVYLMAGTAWLRSGDEPHETVAVHWSPCDEGCRHGGPGRWHRTDAPDLGPWECGDLSKLGPYGAAEASWRQVDVRTLGWAHDLRPERLAVLCLRCFAERTP